MEVGNDDLLDHFEADVVPYELVEEPVTCVSYLVTKVHIVVFPGT